VEAVVRRGIRFFGVVNLGVGCRVYDCKRYLSSHKFVSYEVWIRKALRFRECAEEDLKGGRYDSVAFLRNKPPSFC